MVVLFELKGVNNLPVLLHVHHGPSTIERFIQRLIQMTDFRLSIIGPLPLCVSMVDDEHKSRTFSGRSPLKHLQIALGIAECCDGAVARRFLVRAVVFLVLPVSFLPPVSQVSIVGSRGRPLPGGPRVVHSEKAD